ncbi:MAG: hypothetical protein LBM98_00530 [Oscillospiraceae bacterium]|nr:hypothetical protein [Oscillospiraceae bacterium]
MLRTCNALRIAGVPVLRNDGGGRFADTGVWTKVTVVGRGYWAWIASHGSQ